MPAEKELILLIEDEPQMRRFLRITLQSQGYRLVEAATAREGLTQATMRNPDVVLLDVNLPGEDGFTLARFLRERYDVGIIMVTGAGGVVDRFVGLEVGADDYVAKPFDPRELLARIKSVLRRMQSRPAGAGEEPTIRTIPFGACRLDLASHQLYGSDGAEIPITSMEFDLLKIFAEHPGKALSRDRILTLTKNREWDPFDRSTDIRVARLRRKVEADPDNPQVIRTIRGVGYMFVSVT